MTKEIKIHKLKNVEEGDWVVINSEYYAQINGELVPMQEVVDTVIKATKRVAGRLSEVFANISESI